MKFLYFNRTEGCTTETMDSAAYSGHLDIVQFLHDNRSEGCTTEAMDSTLRIDMLEFLHQNRTEGFTGKAFKNAADSDENVAVLDLLYECRLELLDIREFRGIARLEELAHLDLRLDAVEEEARDA